MYRTTIISARSVNRNDSPTFLLNRPNRLPYASFRCIRFVDPPRMEINSYRLVSPLPPRAVLIFFFISFYPRKNNTRANNNTAAGGKEDRVFFWAPFVVRQRQSLVTTAATRRYYGRSTLIIFYSSTAYNFVQFRNAFQSRTKGYATRHVFPKTTTTEVDRNTFRYRNLSIGNKSSVKNCSRQPTTPPPFCAR